MNSHTVLPGRQINILLVEDDEGDILLTKKALADFPSLSVVRDGVEALAYLRREGDFRGAPRPDLILLDLNMPRMDGRETLAQIKQDELLRAIPVVILTTSNSDRDVQQSYELQAACFITKPADAREFAAAVQSVLGFWTQVARLPQG